MRPGHANEKPAKVPVALAGRIEQIDRLLPQTQCRRCGYEGCRPYAEAIAAAGAPINRCPPGGTATIGELARLLGTAEIAPDPACGASQARHVASIDNSLCIGCTKCIAACPVDAIVGAPKHQHHVLADRCTGCDLCLPPCPVDCISMKVIEAQWSPADAARGRRHHRARLEREAAARTAPAQPGQPGQPAQPAVAVRDPVVALGDPAERARRLAQILQRVHGAGGR
jgi:electron transport complex protein RnfB